MLLLFGCNQKSHILNSSFAVVIQLYLSSDCACLFFEATNQGVVITMGRVRDVAVGLLALITSWLPSSYSFAETPPDSKPAVVIPSGTPSSDEDLEGKLTCVEPVQLTLIIPEYSGIFSDSSSSAPPHPPLEQQLLLYQLRLEQYHHCLALKTLFDQSTSHIHQLKDDLNTLNARNEKYVFFGYSFLSDFPDGLNYHGFEVSYRGRKSTVYLSGGIYFAHVDLGGEKRSTRITFGDLIGGAQPDEKNLTALLINLNLTYIPDYSRWEPASWFYSELGLSSGVSLAIVYNADTYKLVITDAQKKSSRNQDLDAPNDFALTPRFDIAVITGRMTFEWPWHGALALFVKGGYTLQMQDSDPKHSFTLNLGAEIGLPN